MRVKRGNVIYLKGALPVPRPKQKIRDQYFYERQQLRKEADKREQERLLAQKDHVQLVQKHLPTVRECFRKGQNPVGRVPDAVLNTIFELCLV
jgi:hypothetical protein